MKNKLRKSNLAKGLVIGSLVLSQTAFAAGPSQESLQEVYDEEMLAKYIYQEMIDKFDNDTYYQKIMNAEVKHSGSVARFAAKSGLTITEGDYRPEVSDDELTALKAAYDYELKDIEDLEARLSKTTDPGEIRVYQRLMNGSKNHAASLARAIEAYEAGNSDLSQLSGEQKGQNKKSGKELSNKENTKSGRSQKQGKEKALGRDKEQGTRKK